jgi:hypothetical protein
MSIYNYSHKELLIETKMIIIYIDYRSKSVFMDVFFYAALNQKNTEISFDKSHNGTASLLYAFFYDLLNYLL